MLPQIIYSYYKPANAALKVITNTITTLEEYMLDTEDRLQPNSSKAFMLAAAMRWVEPQLRSLHSKLSQLLKDMGVLDTGGGSRAAGAGGLPVSECVSSVKMQPLRMLWRHMRAHIPCDSSAHPLHDGCACRPLLRVCLQGRLW
jgi:hypothetical protein